MTLQTVQPIKWPSVTLAGGQMLTFRLSYAAHFQLAQWGKNVATASVLELAAAAAGSFDPITGKWRSEGFQRALDFADIMEPADEPLVTEALIEAVKKAVPEAEISVQAIPAEATALA
jgi:hypothetical protein